MNDLQERVVYAAYADLRDILQKIEDGVLVTDSIDYDNIQVTLTDLEETFPTFYDKYASSSLVIEDQPGFNDSMDGDLASGLASAGHGTDEDYGSASETL